MVTITCKQQIIHRSLVRWSLSAFSCFPQPGREMGNGQRTWDSRLIASVPGGVLKITRKRCLGYLCDKGGDAGLCCHLLLDSWSHTHTSTLGWGAGTMEKEQYLQSFGLHLHLCSLWKFPLWEKADLIAAVSHSTWSTRWGGVWPKPSGGFALPHAPWVTLV